MDGNRNYHSKCSQPYNETPTSHAITDLWNLKKGQTEVFFRTDTDSQTLKMRQVGRCGDTLRVWNGNAIKFGCNDHYTTTNVIKFIE